jgi:hypothetical protein
MTILPLVLSTTLPHPIPVTNTTVTTTTTTITETVLRTQETAASVINESSKEAQLQLVGQSTPTSDAPEGQAMEDGCCKECGDCIREVCTIECCVGCCVCTCELVCSIFKIFLGVREVERGIERRDPVRVAVGLSAMNGNTTAAAISYFFDQR